MFILEEPYVSDLLATSVAELGLPALDTPIGRRSLTGERAERLGLPARTASLLLSDAEFTAAACRDGARLYSNSEHAIGWVAQHLCGTRLPRQIEQFKDKTAFRDLLADLYPSYHYAAVSLDELATFDISRVPVPFVVKPAVGFFSMCVHVVTCSAQWPPTVAEIKREVRAFQATYPASVLGLDCFIVEEVIEGEEFAVDAYFDADGAPVLVNLYAHRFSSDDDVSDRLYVTDAETVTHFAPSAIAFLEQIGARAGLSDFPVHVELRMDAAGDVAPIEVNPLRFGGWCATDLAHYAYGVNPYRAYMLGEQPDWQRLKQETAGCTTALIVADLPSSVDLAQITSVDYERFAAGFSRLYELRPMDFTRFPVFAFAFVGVPTADQAELQAVLGADLREYLTLRSE